MKPILGGFIGLLAGATFGWLVFGSIPSAGGMGCALGASIYGAMSAFSSRNNDR